MQRPWPHPLILVCIASALLYPRAAAAEVRRCVSASGQTIFTDRKCNEVDAVEAPLPATTPRSAGAQTAAKACARRIDDLVFEMSAAIDARDANRLAGVYHWTGMSGTAGYQIWNRLDAIAKRPLVDIAPVMPIPAAAYTDRTSNDANGASPSPPDPDLYPQTAVRRAPVGLRVEQTLANSATPSRTVFGLVRNFGCWWVRF